MLVVRKIDEKKFPHYHNGSLYAVLLLLGVYIKFINLYNFNYFQ